MIDIFCGKSKIKGMRYFDKPVVKGFLPKVESEMENSVVAEAIAETPLVTRIREGLPFYEFKSLQELLKIPEEELGNLLGISSATLSRRKVARHLGTPESERIVRFARLFGLSMETFGTEEAARSWLKTANPGTYGESPLSYADTEYGAREVENLLGRIEHGVF